MLVGFACSSSSPRPFHLWTPDVMKGAGTGGHLPRHREQDSGVLRAAALLPGSTATSDPMIHWLLAAMAVISIVVGNLALIQTNIKRMMGYSSIFQISAICWRMMPVARKRPSICDVSCSPAMARRHQHDVQPLSRQVMCTVIAAVLEPPYLTVMTVMMLSQAYPMTLVAGSATYLGVTQCPRAWTASSPGMLRSPGLPMRRSLPPARVSLVQGSSPQVSVQ